MICWKCGHNATEKTVTLVSNWKGYKVSIEGIKAEVCENCGEEMYDANDIKLVHALSEGIKSNTKSEELPEILNLSDVARVLKVTNQTIYNMIKAGKLPAKKLGKKWIFLRDDIEKIISPTIQNVLQLV